MNLAYVIERQNLQPQNYSQPQTQVRQAPDQLLEDIRVQAINRAEWSWKDIMVAFNEIGYDPSQNEKDRIMNQLITKKATAMLRKAGYN